MRNQKQKLSISDKIINANKVWKAVERKLPDDILRYCGVEFAERYPYGYLIKFRYHTDSELNKDVEVSFRVSDYDSWVWFDETTWFIKEDFRREHNHYHQEFKRGPNGSWEQGKRKVHNLTVNYIVSNILKYFGTNAEKFIEKI